MISRVMLVGLLAALASVSCSGMKQPYPDKKLYAIDAGKASDVSGTADGSGALSVRPVAIAAPYAGTSFMYKVAPERFEADYYNNFVAEPTRLLTGELVRRLSESGLFKTVSGAGSFISAPLFMEVNLTSFYGDYTNRDAPQAVVEARVFLIRDSASGDDVVFQKTYSVREPAADDNPDALVAAWGRAYGKFIDQLVADLRSAKVAEAR